MEKFHDLSFSRQPDGSIRLMQSDCGEDYIIDMHPAQLRHVAETFGLVAPSHPADELSKRLAVQLCTILRDLEDERHRSHWLELTCTKLDAWCSALPDDIFPHHVWDDEDDGKPIYGASKPHCSTVDISSPTKTQPGATAKATDDNKPDALTVLSAQLF